MQETVPDVAFVVLLPRKRNLESYEKKNATILAHQTLISGNERTAIFIPYGSSHFSLRLSREGRRLLYFVTLDRNACNDDVSKNAILMLSIL